jgi:hypothetical protein
MSVVALLVAYAASCVSLSNKMKLIKNKLRSLFKQFKQSAGDETK